MKLLLIFFLVLNIFLTGGAYAAPPTASFEMMPQSGRSPLTVTFDASSSWDVDNDIRAYVWTFGDGTRGKGKTVTKTYQNPGTYKVELVVNDSVGEFGSKIDYVYVLANQTPKLSLSANPLSGTIPLQVTFDTSLSYDPDGSIVRYAVNFGDGSAPYSSTIPYFNHTFTAAGDYTVTVTAYDNENAPSIPKSQVIRVFQPNSPPVALIDASATSGNSPLTVQFSATRSYDPDGSIQSYSWLFPGGYTKAGAEVSHTFVGQGPQVVSLTVTDDKNVPTTTSLTINLTQDTVAPLISISPDTNSIIRTSTPQFEITHTDNMSGVDLGSIHAYLNGQEVTSRLQTAPNRSLLTFTLEYPIAQGSYELRIDLKDYAGNAATLVNAYQVDLGVIDRSYIVGQVVDEEGNPLQGVSIQDVVVPFGSKVANKSIVDGKFKIPFTLAGTYRLSFNKAGYIETVRTIAPVLVQDIDMGLITMAHSDSVTIPISASTGGTATNSTGTITAIFEPGDLPFDINFSSKEYTTAESMPGPLPPQSAFTYAFDLQPQNIILNNDGVDLYIDNHLGFPVGTEIVYGQFHRELGRWLDSGKTILVSNSNKLEGTALGPISDNYQLPGDPNQPYVCKGPNTCNPPEGAGSGGAGGGGGNNNGCAEDDPCCDSSPPSNPPFMTGLQGSSGYGGGPISTMGCEIDNVTGDLGVAHATPTLTGAGEALSLSFNYHSTSVKPHFFASSELNVFNPEPADYIKSKISILGRTVEAKFDGSGALKKTYYRTLVEAKNADGKYLPTGLYPYTNSLSVAYSNSEYATASYFGGPPRTRLGVLARVPLTFTTVVQEDVPILNRTLSPFGMGWSVFGLEQLHVAPSGKVLRDLGYKKTIQYTPTSSMPLMAEKRLPRLKSNAEPTISSLAVFDGIVYATDCENNMVYRVSADGSFDVVAGNGERGFTGDKGLAVNASLNCPVAIAKAETGGFYIADRDNFRIRRVFRDGTIKTIAKHSSKPLSVSEDKMRAVFFTTVNEVMLITPRGKLETYSAKDTGYLPVNLNSPSQVFFNNEDYPVVIDKMNGRVITLYPQNQSYSTLFGKGSFNKTNSNGAIKPKSISFDPVSHLYYMLDTEGKIYHWDLHGKGDLIELAFVNNSLREKRFGQKVASKISHMAFSPDTGLVLVTDGSLFVGKRAKNKMSSAMTYTTEGGYTSELTKLENGSYEITDTEKVKKTYNAKGLITAVIRPNGKNTFYQYSENDLIKEIQMPGGVKFFFEFDGRGYVKAVRDSANRETSFHIDDSGKLLSITNPDGSVKEFTYTSDGLLTTEKKEDGEFTEFFYDGNKISGERLSGGRERSFSAIAKAGLIPLTANKNDILTPIEQKDLYAKTQVSKSGDCESHYKVNNLGALTESINCLGRKAEFTPNSSGMFTQIKSPEGRIINRDFDSKNRLITSRDHQGLTTYSYDPQSGKESIITDSLNYTVKKTYNTLGLIENVIDQKENSTHFEYTPFGNLSLIRDALGHETHFEYDENQNLKRVIDPSGNDVEYTRDPAGNIIQQKDQLNRVTNFEYDAFNRLTAILSPLNNSTLMSYDQKGKIRTVTNAVNKTTEFDYDPQSLKVSKVANPSGQEERYLYDDNDRISKKINKDGTEITYTYDLLGNLKKKSSLTQTNSYLYDKDNLLVLASNGDAGVMMSYDRYGRLEASESSHVPGTLKLTYDERGLRKTLNYDIGNSSILSVEYSYDERKLLSKMKAFVGGWPVVWQRFWDELGRPETDIYSNGMKTMRQYDENGRMTYLSNEYTNGEPLSRFDLTYNANNTIKEILKSFTQPNQTGIGRYVLKYTYDELDRLIYASTDGNFTYDPMGNHTNRGQIHNDLNQLLEDAEYNYTYTENGHLWKKVSKFTGERTEYEWSIEGKMTKSQVVRPDGSIKSLVIHKYDALERRISKETNGVLTRYAYDNDDIIVEFGSNDTIKAVYLHGPGIDEPIAMARDGNEDGRFDKKEVFFYSKDHLNSVHDLTDFEGKLVQRYNYSAYGKTKIEKTNPDLNAKLVKSPYGYTSREWDQETGDYYYRARFYDPRSGRFLSEDQIGFQGNDVNFYRYIKNNPMNSSDPSGNLPVPILICPTLGSCPKTMLKCLIFSGIIVDSAEISEWTRQCEEEKEQRKNPDACSETRAE